MKQSNTQSKKQIAQQIIDGLKLRLTAEFKLIS